MEIANEDGPHVLAIGLNVSTADWIREAGATAEIGRVVGHGDYLIELIVAETLLDVSLESKMMIDTYLESKLTLIVHLKLSQDTIVEIVRSLLQLGDGSAKSERGVDFEELLELVDGQDAAIRALDEVES